MKTIECLIVHANEEQEKVGTVDLSAALRILKEFPWEEENKQAEQTGCYPAVCFAATPLSKGSEYLNITKLDNLNLDVQMESFKESKILGLIPWKKSAYLIQDGLSQISAEQIISQFFKLQKDTLFDWIENYKKQN